MKSHLNADEEESKRIMENKTLSKRQEKETLKNKPSVLQPVITNRRFKPFRLRKLLITRAEAPELRWTYPGGISRVSSAQHRTCCSHWVRCYEASPPARAAQQTPVVPRLWRNPRLWRRWHRFGVAKSLNERAPPRSKVIDIKDSSYKKLVEPYLDLVAVRTRIIMALHGRSSNPGAP